MAPARFQRLASTAFVAALAATSAYAIVTGILDILIPALTDTERFAALKRGAELWGPNYLFLHIFLHNLGLATLVPGVGLIAAAFEKDPRKRRLIAPLLAGAVVLSMASAVELVVRRGYIDEGIVLPLLVWELSAVLFLTWMGVRVLKDYVPTRRPEWSWIHPARRLATPALFTAILLASAAFVETQWVWRALGP